MNKETNFEGLDVNPAFAKPIVIGALPSLENAHRGTLSNFYDFAERYAKKFSYKKLKRLIGEDLVYKKDKYWCYNNLKILRMSIPQLKNLIKNIENAAY